MADPFTWDQDSPYSQLTPANLNLALDTRAWNLAVNPILSAFDENDKPSWWGYTGTVAKESTIAESGGASAKISSGGSIRQDYYGLLGEGWRGTKVTVALRGRQEAADALTLAVDFGVATVTATTKSTPVGDFFTWSETFTVNASATKLELQIGASGDTTYVDRVSFWEGETMGSLFSERDGAPLLLCEGRGNSSAFEAGYAPRIASGFASSFTSLTGLGAGTITDSFSTSTPDFWPAGTSNPVGAGSGDEVLPFPTWDTAGSGNNANKAIGLVGGLQTDGKLRLTANCAVGSTFGSDDLGVSGLIFLYPHGPEPPVSRAWTDQ